MLGKSLGTGPSIHQHQLIEHALQSGHLLPCTHCMGHAPTSPTPNLLPEHLTIPLKAGPLAGSCDPALLTSGTMQESHLTQGSV